MTDLTIPSLFVVNNKVALVTGGGAGIGYMIADTLVQNGAKVYIASRKEKQLQQVRELLDRRGPGRCQYIVADLGSKAGCDALSDSFKQRESKLHVLVNNSGVTWAAPMDQFPEKQGWDRVIALNVKSIFYMTTNLTELLTKDSTAPDPGRVVNISSVGSLSAHAETVWSYSTSKAAVNHLTSTMAVSLAPKFITVNAILPGFYPSRATAYVYDKHAAELNKSHPMGRVGSPGDMAGLFLFFVSPAGAHVTGAQVETDGGTRISGIKLKL